MVRCWFDVQLWTLSHLFQTQSASKSVRAWWTRRKNGAVLCLKSSTGTSSRPYSSSTHSTTLGSAKMPWRLTVQLSCARTWTCEKLSTPEPNSFEKVRKSFAQRKMECFLHHVPHTPCYRRASSSLSHLRATQCSRHLGLGSTTSIIGATWQKCWKWLMHWENAPVSFCESDIYLNLKNQKNLYKVKMLPHFQTCIIFLYESAWVTGCNNVLARRRKKAKKRRFFFFFFLLGITRGWDFFNFLSWFW